MNEALSLFAPPWGPSGLGMFPPAFESLCTQSQLKHPQSVCERNAHHGFIAV